MAENTEVTTRKVNKPKADKKVKVIVEPRFEEDLKKKQQFFGFNSYNITVHFGKEVEIPESVVEMIKGLGRYVSTVENGELVKKWNKRFFVEKV